MKGKLIYIALFLAAFVITTMAIMYFNGLYNNIFAFDFSAPKPQVHQPKTLKDTEAPISLTTRDNTEKIAQPTADTASVKVNIEQPVSEKSQLSTLTDSIKSITAAPEIKIAENKIEEKKPEERPVVKEKVTQTKEYLQWTKKTAGLYEAMDAKRAAKIIQNYSDNVARDIIYAMKKKKAAEILSILSPEIAQRITRVQH